MIYSTADGGRGADLHRMMIHGPNIQAPLRLVLKEMILQNPPSATTAAVGSGGVGRADWNICCGAFFG